MMEKLASLFGSDNESGVHPRILQAFMDACTGDAIGYGNDPWTETAVERIVWHFGEKAQPFFVFGGTGANITALGALLDGPGDAVICSSCAHINTNEGGAPERILGCKLIGLSTQDGKIWPRLIQEHMTDGTPHQVRPKVLSITNPTEFGTVYTVTELRELVDFAHEHGMKVHLDGARLSNAVAYLGTTLATLTSESGVDVVCFGGTKNGMPSAEAVVAFCPETADRIPRARINACQLSSKMRLLSAPFAEYMTDGLWLENARNANRMASLLVKGIKFHCQSKVTVTQAVQTNAVFLQMPYDAIERLRQQTFFYDWDKGQGIIRLMCSFDTTEESVSELVCLIAASL